MIGSPAVIDAELQKFSWSLSTEKPPNPNLKILKVGYLCFQSQNLGKELSRWLLSSVKTCGNAAIMGKAARVSGLQMHKQSRRILSYLPRVHLHVMCVEEEDGGRNESDVKVADINLNLCCIHIYQPYWCKLWYISHRFSQLFTSCTSTHTHQNLFLKLVDTNRGGEE